jgi:hypothetical protein
LSWCHPQTQMPAIQHSPDSVKGVHGLAELRAFAGEYKTMTNSFDAIHHTLSRARLQGG